MTISIIDTDFNLKAQIDDYESLTWVRRWHKPGSFELHINAKKNNVGELQKGRVVLHGTKAAFILHREISISESGEEVVMVRGASVSSMLGRRITIPPEGKAYDRINSQIETIMKSYVDTNAINPVDIKRRLPNLELTVDQGRGAKMVYQSRLKMLDEELEKLSIVSGLGWKVSLDLENERWVFDVYEGRDLTAGQEINPPVIFSVGFDSIKAQTFVDSELGHKNLAYVGGQGQGAERAIVKVGQELTGLDRLETFVDARDIEDGADLPDRGAQKLSEMGKVFTFENDVLTDGPFVYGTDWDLGDIVTAINRGWGVTLDSRITEVTEVYEPGGFKLQATFGDSMPTLVEKIKKEMDMPLIENVTAGSVDNLTGAHIEAALGYTPADEDDIPDISGKLDKSGGVLENYREKLVTLANGTIDLSTGNNFTHAPTVATTYSITNAGAGAHSFTLIITQPATAVTLTFPASVDWGSNGIPDMTTASKIYVLTFISVNGGVKWLGMFGGAY